MRNFHALEFVGRGSETQLQVGEKIIYSIKVAQCLWLTEYICLDMLGLNRAEL